MSAFNASCTAPVPNRFLRQYILFYLSRVHIKPNGIFWASSLWFLASARTPRAEVGSEEEADGV
jgi:hypothetical protein